MTRLLQDMLYRFINKESMLMDRHKTSSAESGLAFPPETINLTQFTWHKIYFLPVFRTNEKHQAWKGKRKKKKEQDTQRT